MSASRLTLAVLAATVREGDLLYEGVATRTPFEHLPGPLLGKVVRVYEEEGVVIGWVNPFGEYGEYEKRTFDPDARVYVRRWP